MRYDMISCDVIWRKKVWYAIYLYTVYMHYEHAYMNVYDVEVYRKCVYGYVSKWGALFDTNITLNLG